MIEEKVDQAASAWFVYAASRLPGSYFTATRSAFDSQPLETCPCALVNTM